MNQTGVQLHSLSITQALLLLHFFLKVKETLACCQCTESSQIACGDPEAKEARRVSNSPSRVDSALMPPTPQSAKRQNVDNPRIPRM